MSTSGVFQGRGLRTLNLEGKGAHWRGTLGGQVNYVKGDETEKGQSLALVSLLGNARGPCLDPFTKEGCCECSLLRGPICNLLCPWNCLLSMEATPPGRLYLPWRRPTADQWLTLGWGETSSVVQVTLPSSPRAWLKLSFPPSVPPLSLPHPHAIHQLHENSLTSKEPDPSKTLGVKLPWSLGSIW